MSADDRQVGGDHYKTMTVQPWTVMQAVLTHEEFVGYLKGCIIKYAMRDGRKANANDDAEKCQHYIDKLNEVADTAEARKSVTALTRTLFAAASADT